MKINFHKYIFSAVTILLSSFFFGCFKSADSNQLTPPSEQNISIPASEIDLLKPFDLSKQPDDILIAKSIDNLVNQANFANARIGIFAISLKDGRIIAANDAQKLFNPASIQKTLTSIVALDKLGAEFQWKTRMLAEKPIENGTLNCDLILYGEGSPDLDDVALDKFVSELQSKGLKRIAGNIIGDESYFKGDKIGDGWAWNELQWYYGADASALTFNENQAKLTLENRKPKISTDFAPANGETKPTKDIESIGVKRELGENEVYVWGNGDSLDAKISVSNSALWAAKSLKEKLLKRGIGVDGEAKAATRKEEIDRSNSTELASIESRSLAEIVRKMNKESVNLYAELILRTLGKKFGSEAPDENPKLNKLRGDDSAGANVIAKWLKDNKIADSSISIHDGSGLSRLDFVSPETFGRALVFANQAKFAENFKNSLPIAGIDGTLRGRLRGKSVVAKTGSMSYVSSIAGYLIDSKGESFAFAVMLNNQTRKDDSTALIDSIINNLLR